MKRLKKVIITFFIILLILVSILIIVKYKCSKLYMKRLLDKGCMNINYSTYYEGELQSYIKGNIEKSIFSNGNILYCDYETGEKIFIDAENKTINISRDSNKDLGPQKSKYVKDISEKQYEYKGKEIIKDDIDCYVIDLYKNEKNSSSYLVTRIWINCKLGVIEKIAYYNKSEYSEKMISETIYNMHTGVVTDENIQKPNITEYPDYEIIEQ